MKNIEKFYKKQKQSQLRKRNPLETLLQKNCTALESDLLSISTKSDHNYDNQLDLESESESETKSVVTQRIINTARRAEPLMKIVKNFSKAAPIARKIDHEWVENYRT